MEPLQALEQIDASVREAMARGLGKKGLAFPLDPDRIDPPALKAICLRLAAFFDLINEAYRLAARLARGDLKAEASRQNPFAMPIKELQASLCHLTWQTRRVADGDLHQQVHFLGEFSDSFNRMIGALKEKEILEQRLATIMDVIGEGILFVDTDGRIRFANPEAQRLLGHTFDEMSGSCIHEIVHKQRPDGSYLRQDENPLLAAIASGTNFTHEESVFTCKSGLLMPVMIICRPVLKQTGTEGAVIAFRDISEQKNHVAILKNLNDILEKMASTDSLTGIQNRMAFDRAAKIELERARRYRSPLSLILFDIDKFKQINDAHGHLKGDEILKQITTLVSGHIRQTDIFARWGGEEFVILSSCIDLNAAFLFAEKLRRLIERNVFPGLGEVTASFGVTAFQEGDDMDALIRNADAALYRAKASGRNRVMTSE